jgi:drug/metabolite transporter (DMT)-like permease
MQTQTQREARVEKLAIDIGLAEGVDVNIVATERAPNIDALLSRSAAWQLGLGCLPLFANSLAYERPDPAALSTFGWSAIVFNILIQQCAGYACWLAALHRLPASVAAISTMVVPVGGVLFSAAWLHESLGPFQITALICVVLSVALAVRS